MNLLAIKENQFPLWKTMRKGIYQSLDDEFHDREMKHILVSSDWFSYFLMSEEKQLIGMVEISTRNIVDGCLSSPVAYIEGLFIKNEFRGLGLGRETIKMIKHWCKQKGFTELALDTEIKNVAAQRFFKAVGLKETYRIVQFRIDIERLYLTGGK